MFHLFYIMMNIRLDSDQHELVLTYTQQLQLGTHSHTVR